MVSKDPTKNQMIRFLRKRYEKLMPEAYPESLLDTILIAIWWFANDYHGGQWTNLYKTLCAIPYKPGRMMTLEKEDETVQMMYDDLADKYEIPGSLSAFGANEIGMLKWKRDTDAPIPNYYSLDGRFRIYRSTNLECWVLQDYMTGINPKTLSYEPVFYGDSLADAKKEAEHRLTVAMPQRIKEMGSPESVAAYNPLTKEQIDIVVEMAKQEKVRNSATRILINGQAMNVTTGEVASRGSNVMYHPVYWDLNREAAKTMQQFVQNNNPGQRVTMDYQTA